MLLSGRIVQSRLTGNSIHWYYLKAGKRRVICLFSCICCIRTVIAEYSSCCGRYTALNKMLLAIQSVTQSGKIINFSGVRILSLGSYFPLDLIQGLFKHLLLLQPLRAWQQRYGDIIQRSEFKNCCALICTKDGSGKRPTF